MSTASTTPPRRVGGEHQQPVVGSDQQAVFLGRAQRDAPARACRPADADRRIDDREVDPAGMWASASRSTSAPVAHVVARDRVGDVDHPRLRAAAGDHAVADADELVAWP